MPISMCSSLFVVLHFHTICQHVYLLVDGLTCTRKIRALEADGTIVRHVPIIAVTANARLEQIETAIATGMVRISRIPCSLDEAN